MSHYIDSQSELENFVKELEGSELLAIDTEFLREKTYYPQLCLLQMNNGQTSALIDPLAIDDLSPLVGILADKNCTKIFHAGSQDIGILFHATGVVPTPLFDTQVAASLLGHPLQVGYGPLVRSLCDVRLAKADSYTDWSRRPLSNNQLKYALDDVAYLPQMYKQLKHKLERSNRMGWFELETAELTDPAHYDNDPREMWRRVKRVSSLSRGQLAIARELAAWRETEAMSRDIPRKWVLSDEALIEVARKAPRTAERLLEVRGLASKLSERDINQVLEAVRKGKEQPQSQWPKLPRHAKGDTAIDGAVDLMAALVELRAKENDVAAPLLATHSELSRIARGHRDEAAVLSGWRYEMVGRDLIDLLEGRLALFLEDGRIEVTERQRSS